MNKSPGVSKIEKFNLNLKYDIAIGPNYDRVYEMQATLNITAEDIIKKINEIIDALNYIGGADIKEEPKPYL